MDRNTVQGAIRWLLNSRDQQGKGWGRWPGDSPSVTITAEVVIALLRIPAEMVPPPEARDIQGAIHGGLDFIEETLPKRSDADLPNFAYAAIAQLRANSSPNPNFLKYLLTGVLAFQQSLEGWKPRASATHPSTFGTCLAVLALHDFLHTQNGIQLLASDENLRNQARLAYSQATDALFTRHLQETEGGWRDLESSNDSGHPAITALALYARTRHLQALGATQLMNDPVCARAIEFLCRNAPTIASEWTYQLRESDYQLFFVPYIVLALSDHLDWLTQSQLEFYYGIAGLLAGPDMRIYNAQAELSEWFSSPRDKTSRPVWATAHALRGILSVPLSGQALSFVNQMMIQRDQQKRQNEWLLKRPASSPLDPHIRLGVRGCWVQLSELALFVIAALLSIGLATVYWLYLPKDGTVKTLTLVAEILLCWMASYPLMPRDGNVIVRIMQAFLGAATIVGLVALVLQQLT